MSKRPAFQFYPQDFISDIRVQAMDNEELGAYIRLLCHDWIEDGLPDDDLILSRISGARENWDRIKMPLASCFQKIDGKLFNPRLIEERKKQDKFRKEKTSVGKIGAKARWNKKKQEMPEASAGNAKAMPKDSSSSSSSSSINTLIEASDDQEISEIEEACHEHCGGWFPQCLEAVKTYGRDSVLEALAVAGSVRKTKGGVVGWPFVEKTLQGLPKGFKRTQPKNLAKEEDDNFPRY